MSQIIENPSEFQSSRLDGQELSFIPAGFDFEAAEATAERFLENFVRLVSAFGLDVAGGTTMAIGICVLLDSAQRGASLLEYTGDPLNAFPGLKAGLVTTAGALFSWMALHTARGIKAKN